MNTNSNTANIESATVKTKNRRSLSAECDVVDRGGVVNSSVIVGGRGGAKSSDGISSYLGFWLQNIEVQQLVYLLGSVVPHLLWSSTHNLLRCETLPFVTVNSVAQAWAGLQTLPLMQSEPLQ